jgi:hypothetical protein
MFDSLSAQLTDASHSSAIRLASETFGLEGFTSISTHSIARGRQKGTQTGLPKQ